jgi:hypothetical protein
MLSTARSVKSWTLVVDNLLEASFYNSTTATRIMAKDRAVTFDCTNPFTSAEADLYGQALAGAAASLALAGGGQTLAFAFGTLQVPSKGPVIQGRQEIPLMLSGVARQAGDTPELTVTLG